MNKHTPGPWSTPVPIIRDHGVPFSPVVAGTLIAKVYSNHFGDEAQSIANAKLIAAAPDLLAALEGLLDQVAGFNVSGVYFSGFVEAKTAMGIAHDAITKAKGSEA